MKKYLIILIILLSLLFQFGCQKPAKPQNELPTKNETKVDKTTSVPSFDNEEATRDPFNDPGGPFFHKVYKATSKDGLTFTKDSKVLFDKASVPDVVKMNDGRLILYAVDGGGRSLSGLMVAISKDNGKTFNQGSVQFSSRAIGLADPQAILTDDGRVRLFYVQFPEKKPPLDETGKPIPTGDKIKIKTAISSDGINFDVEAGSRYETTEIVTDPDIIKIGSKWFMYLSKGSELIAASSVDGENFKLEKSIRMQGSVSKTVAVGSSKYRQFFCKDGLSSATTTDGLNFADEGIRLNAGQSEILCDPTPVKIGNEWLMFFKVQKENMLKPPL